jgi:DNA-binding beta-propeller fold protein YncE
MTIGRAARRHPLGATVIVVVLVTFTLLGFLALGWSSGKVSGPLHSINVGGDPYYATYDPRSGDVYVVNGASNNVTVIHGMSVVGSVNAGSDPLFATYDGGNGYVYVVNSGGYAGSNNSSVSVINVTSIVASVIVGDYPWLSTYDSRNGFIYVTDSNSTNVSVISGTVLVDTVEVGSYPEDLTYDAENGYIYVPNLGTDNVSVINGTTLVGSLNVGSEPWSATYDATNGYVYIANVNSSHVSVIAGTSMIGSVSVGGDPGYTAYGVYDSGNGFVYLSNGGAETEDVIDGTNLVASIPTGGAPAFPAYDPDNGQVYVPELPGPCLTVYLIPTAGTVAVISGTSIVATEEVGGNPSCAVFASGNGYVYVSDYDTGDISVIGPQSGAPMLLGLPSTEGYGLLAVVGAAIVTGTVVLVDLKRWGKNTRGSESLPPDPARDELTSPRR